MHLPAEGIVIAGDLVIHPVPYGGNPQSHPGDWGATLERLLALKHTMIVPGHGPVLRDDAYVQLGAPLHLNAPTGRGDRRARRDD